MQSPDLFGQQAKNTVAVYREAFDQFSNAMIFVTAPGIITTVNRSAIEDTGHYAAAQLIGSELSNMLPDGLDVSDDVDAGAEIAAWFSNPKPIVLDQKIRIRCNPGERPPGIPAHRHGVVKVSAYEQRPLDAQDLDVTTPAPVFMLLEIIWTDA